MNEGVRECMNEKKSLVISHWGRNGTVHWSLGKKCQPYLGIDRSTFMTSDQYPVTNIQ